MYIFESGKCCLPATVRTICKYSVANDKMRRYIVEYQDNYYFAHFDANYREYGINVIDDINGMIDKAKINIVKTNDEMKAKVVLYKNTYYILRFLPIYGYYTISSQHKTLDELDIAWRELCSTLVIAKIKSPNGSVENVFVRIIKKTSQNYCVIEYNDKFWLAIFIPFASFDNEPITIGDYLVLRECKTNKYH